MKRFLRFIYIFTVCVTTAGAFFLVFPENAQAATYEAKSGDNLWDLLKAHNMDPTKWREIVGLNPFLEEPGRAFYKGGKIILLVRPGEKIEGLERLKINAIPVPLSELGIAVTSTSLPQAVWNFLTKEVDWTFWFLGAVIAVVFAALLNGRKITRKIRSIFASASEKKERVRHPIIEGGILPANSEAVGERFERIAERRLGEINPLADLRSERPHRISAVESGFLSGRGLVRYRDYSERRRLEKEPAYRAIFRFPDGKEEELFFLQKCANDVTFEGTRYEGFIFVPVRIIIAAPRPTMTPLRSPQAPPAMDPDSTVAATTTVVVGNIQMVLPEGATVQIIDDGARVKILQPCESVIQDANQKTEEKAS